MTVPRDPAHDALNRRSVIAILRKRAAQDQQVRLSPDMALWIAEQLDVIDALGIVTGADAEAILREIRDGTPDTPERVQWMRESAELYRNVKARSARPDTANEEA